MMSSSTDSQKLSPELSKHLSKPKSCSCLNITKLILAAMPTIAFGVFTIVFTIQQNLVARENRKQDQEQAEEKSIRTTYENYINDISGLLLDRKFNRSNPEHLLHIRIKTMSVLRHVDANRKRDIIWFLYESHLLRSNIPVNERLDLTGSDLSNVQFVGRRAALLKLSYIYLPRVFAPNITFEWCSAEAAVFDNAFMPNAKILYSIINNTSFFQIYAPGLILGDLILYGNNFQGAILRQTEFSSGIDLHGSIDLRNADLLDSFRIDAVYINNSEFISRGLNYQNARLFDGSFGPINDSNLVIDGTAEETCQSNKNETRWSMMNSHWPVETGYEDRDSPTVDLGNCSFIFRRLNETFMGQFISINLFSVLVDSGQAAYNLSAYAGCTGEGSNKMKIYIACYKETLLSTHKREEISITSSPRQFTNITRSIPIETRFIGIEIMSVISNSSGFCLIDNIKLNIFHHKKKN